MLGIVHKGYRIVLWAFRIKKSWIRSFKLGFLKIQIHSLVLLFLADSMVNEWSWGWMEGAAVLLDWWWELRKKPRSISCPISSDSKNPIWCSNGGLKTSEEQIAVIIRDNVSLRFKNDSLKRERKKKQQLHFFGPLILVQELKP